MFPVYLKSDGVVLGVRGVARAEKDKGTQETPRERGQKGQSHHSIKANKKYKKTVAMYAVDAL
jgi:hypothetical protein